MEAPPPYAPPRPKSRVGLIVGIVVGVFVLCCILPMGLLGGGGYWLFTKGKGMVTCILVVKAARDGVVKYAEEHEGKLPPAATWQTAIGPYFEQSLPSRRDAGPFKIPSADGDWACEGEPAPTGIAYNDAIAGKKLEEIRNKYDTPLVFEVPHPGRNVHQVFKELPFTDSQKIFGQPRGWLIMPVEGDSYTMKNGQRIKMGSNGTSFNVNVDDSPSTPTPPRPPKASGGSDGADGADANGTDGKDGEAGTDGKNGENGKPGADSNN